MARTGRPKAENPKTKKVDVRLTEYEYARLKEYAKRHIAIRSREDDCFVVNFYRFFLVYHNKKGMV